MVDKKSMFLVIILTYNFVVITIQLYYSLFGNYTPAQNLLIIGSQCSLKGVE